MNTITLKLKLPLNEKEQRLVDYIYKKENELYAEFHYDRGEMTEQRKPSITVLGKRYHVKNIVAKQDLSILESLNYEFFNNGMNRETAKFIELNAMLEKSKWIEIELCS